MTFRTAGPLPEGESLADLSHLSTEVSTASMIPEQTLLPFLIRGHHVLIFAAFTRISPGSFRPPLSPNEVAGEITKNYRNDQLEAMRQPNYLQTAEYKYATDVIGDQPHQRQQYRQKSRDLFTAFDRLPDSHPVKLGAVRDELCKTCIFGNHCMTSADEYGPLAATRLKRDVTVVEQFIDAATNHSFAEKIVVLEEMTDYEDMERQRVPAVLTSAGIFRALICKAYKNGVGFRATDEERVN